MCNIYIYIYIYIYQLYIDLYIYIYIYIYISCIFVCFLYSYIYNQLYVCMYYIYISVVCICVIYRCHHHVALQSQIPLTLTHHPSLSSIVHHSQEATSCISTKLSHIGFSYSSMWRDPQDYITYEFILPSLAMSWMSVLSNMDSFRDG